MASFAWTSVLTAPAIGVPSATVALAFAGAVDPRVAAAGLVVGGALGIAALRGRPRAGPPREDAAVARVEPPTEEEIVHTDQIESLGVLAGGIAHDFNNLLTGILGNTALALNDLPAGPTRDLIVDADRAARRARELVAQILAYSGRGVLELRPIDLPGLVRETHALLSRVLSPRAQVEVHGRDDLLIEADPAQIRQVVMNLLTNASDALVDGEGRIVVHLSLARLTRRDLDRSLLGRELPPGRYVRLEVRDTGRGMSADTMDRMFEPYFTTKANGRGLGLAALLGIVRNHRGTVEVESILGHGTNISVYFPAPVGRLTVSPSDPGTPYTHATRSGRVLLAEDEEMVRRVAARMLSKLGYDVVEVSDGHEAFAELARDRDYALALIDVQMPGVDGRQVLRRLREQRPRVPAVLMTGYAGEDTDGAGQPDAWLRKPFSLRELTHALDEAQLGGPRESAAN